MAYVYDLVKNRKVFSLDADRTVLEASRYMMEHNIGAVPVLRDGALVGIFSERDIVTRVVAESRNPAETPIAVVMTRDPIVAEPADEIEDAVQKMMAGNFRHLPVVNAGNLLGMISIRDLLQIALGDDGYCVLVSAEGTALRLAPEQSPDLILLDLSRALAHGHALIRTLRAEAATAHSPLVGFSARHDGALLAEQMKLDDFAIVSPCGAPSAALR